MPVNSRLVVVPLLTCGLLLAGSAKAKGDDVSAEHVIRAAVPILDKGWDGRGTAQCHHAYYRENTGAPLVPG